MNPNEIIEKVLGHPVKVKLLRYLIKNPSSNKSGRDLAHITSVSPPTIMTHLKDLCDQGLVFKQIVGKNYTFRLNSDNILIKSVIIPIFEAEANLISSFIELLTRNLDNRSIETIVLYGGIGRGKTDPKSDWDLLILCKEKGDIERIRMQLEEKTPLIRQTFSSTIDIKIFHTADFVRRYVKGDKFALRVYSDFLNSRMKNPLAGKSLTQIINTYGRKKD